MVNTLDVSRLINVQAQLAQAGAVGRLFNQLLIMGDSNVISGLERIRTYSDLKGIAADFGTSAPEYLAAEIYFVQKPKPSTAAVGRWLRTATAGMNQGAILTVAQQALSNFTAVTSGGMTISVDAVVKNLMALDFSVALNLNNVASIVTAAFSGSATCVWTGFEFIVTSATTGTSSSVGYATAPGSGQDISTLLGLTVALSLPLVPGYAPETALDAVVALDAASNNWYGLEFGSSVMPSTSDFLEIAAFIEADEVTRLLGITITDTSVLSSEVTNDLASQLMALNYEQTFTVYSSTNPYAAGSIHGRFFTIDLNGSNTMIDVMYKQMPGVLAENLTDNQANTLQAKRCNVFVAYDNDTSIIQYGTCAGPVFIDETYGLNAMSNGIQTAVFNVLYTSTTKVSQTDAGDTQFNGAISQVCQQYVINGFLATPLGMLIAGFLALLALWDDFQVWREGGESLINWGSSMTKTIVGLVAAIGLGVAALYAWKGAMVAWNAVSKAFELILAVMNGELGVTAALAAILEAPFWLIAAAIGAVIAAVTLADAKWQIFGGHLSSFFSGVGGKVLDFLGGAHAGNVAAATAPGPLTGGAAGNTQKVNQETNIIVQGSADANSVGKAVASQQNAVNFDMTRNLKGAMR